MNTFKNPFSGLRLDLADHRMDAGENAFFLRELEYILNEQFDIKYAELKGRLFVPSDNSVDPGAESVTYRQFDSRGKAKRIADGSEDLPIVNVFGKESTQRMQSYGAAFSYSIQEIRAAAMARRPLERMRAMAARRTLDQQLDSIAAVGDADASLSGLLTLSGTDSFTVPTGGAGKTTWADKTPDEILQDMSGIVRQVVVNTKEIERPTRLILPTQEFELISRKARSAVSDTTILGFFKGNHPDIEVVSWERLAEAGSAGDVNTTDGLQHRMVAYDPKLMNLRLLMGIEFSMMPPQLKNMTYVINCEVRTGGVISPYPKSIIFGDGL